MVYPIEHVLLRFNGHFGTAGTISDRWSVGMRFGQNTIAPVYDAGKLQTFVNAAQTAANTFHANVSTAAGSNCFLDFVSGAQIGVSGKYTPTDQLTVISPTSNTAGGGTAILPWNTAHVISLRTARPRGRASNGRVYWPMLAASVQATSGRLVNASVLNRVTAFQTFVTALNAAANTYSTGTRLIVASNVGGGINAQVNSIRADERLDSIERRENDTAATWQTLPIT